MKAHLNEVDINPVLRKGNLGEISLQEKQETQEEKTFPETFLAVADRVFSRQGIARSILIQAVLVRNIFTNISKYCILIQADQAGMIKKLFLQALGFTSFWLTAGLLPDRTAGTFKKREVRESEEQTSSNYVHSLLSRESQKYN